MFIYFEGRINPKFKCDIFHETKFYFLEDSVNKYHCEERDFKNLFSSFGRIRKGWEATFNLSLMKLIWCQRQILGPRQSVLGINADSRTSSRDAEVCDCRPRTRDVCRAKPAQLAVLADVAAYVMLTDMRRGFPPPRTQPPVLRVLTCSLKSEQGEVKKCCGAWGLWTQHVLRVTATAFAAETRREAGNREKTRFFFPFPISSLQRYKKYSSANAFSCGEAVYTHADRLVTSKATAGTSGKYGKKCFNYP